MPVGITPPPRLAVGWKVKVRTDAGESEWSEPGSWEHGLLDVVGLDRAVDRAGRARWWTPALQRPAYQLAGTVHIGAPVERARLYATAHGVYECFVNGTRVGDLELTPGWTAYRKRLQVQTYDVTDLVDRGRERRGRDPQRRLVARAEQRGPARERLRPNDRVPRAARRHPHLGRRPSRSGTDDGWRSTPSHIVAADLIAGEVHDYRRRVRLAAPATGGIRSEPPTTATTSSARLPRPPVRRVEELRPVSIRELCTRASRRRLRPEHQRLDPVARARPGRHKDHADVRRVARQGRRRDARPHRRRHVDLARPAGALPAGHRDRGRRRQRCVRTAAQHEGLPVRPHRGLRRHPRHRRRDGRRRAHRLRAPRHLRVLRRAHQRDPSHRGVELPRQRLRHPNRLPDPRARGLDRRLADLRRDRGLPVRRRRLLGEVAARPRRGAASRRQGHEPRPGIASGRRPSAELLAGHRRFRRVG